MDHQRRNLILMFTDTVLFTNAMTFLSINAIITYFLSNLGASTFEIGLSNALVSIGAFVSQPVFAKMVMNLSYKAGTFVKILLTQRIFFFLFVLTIPFVSVSHPRAMVVLFLICWAIFSSFVGSYGPFYTSLLAKLIAEQKRGRLRGFSGGLGNLLALGSAFFAGYLLKEVAYPYNYTIIFVIGSLLLILDALDFALLKEEPDQIVPIQMNYFQYFKYIPEILREKGFKKIVLGFSFLMISQVSLAYYVLYAVREFAAKAPEIALFTALTGLINIVGSILFGLLADKFGHRFILLAAALSGGIGGLAVVGFHQLWAVYAGFALTTLCMGGYNISSIILIIDSVNREKLPMCVSVNTLITLIVSSVVTLGGGLLVDRVSFQAIFIIAGIAGFLGFAALYVRGTDSKLKPKHKQRA